MSLIICKIGDDRNFAVLSSMEVATALGLEYTPEFNQAVKLVVRPLLKARLTIEDGAESTPVELTRITGARIDVAATGLEIMQLAVANGGRVVEQLEMLGLYWQQSGYKGGMVYPDNVDELFLLEQLDAANSGREPARWTPPAKPKARAKSKPQSKGKAKRSRSTPRAKPKARAESKDEPIFTTSQLGVIKGIVAEANKALLAEIRTLIAG